MRNLNKGWKNYELIKNHQLMFANVSAFEVIFLSEALKDKERLLGRFYSFIAGKRGYNINIGAYGPNHTKYAKDIDAIVKSFKVINNSGGR